MNMFDFGKAIESLKAGHKVARTGWNGKGMWLALVDGDAWSLNRSVPTFSAIATDTDRFLPWIGMRTADRGFVPWLASQTDVLAEDWTRVD